MKFRVLGCDGGRGLGCENTTLMIGKHVLIDAGTIQTKLSLEEALEITDIFFTHTHLDHIVDLPFLLDATFAKRNKPLRLHGLKEALDPLMEHVFNDKIWPDFSKLPDEEHGQFEIHYIEPEQEVHVDDYAFTPIRVDHTVPTVGYKIAHKNGSIIFSGDTGPVESIWKVANTTNDLKAVILDLSFPNNEQHIANASKHMTANDFEKQILKLEKDCDVYAFHFKVGLDDILKSEVSHIKHFNKPIKALRDVKGIEF